jgi:regulator of nucleoside diphosphate kinase
MTDDSIRITETDLLRLTNLEIPRALETELDRAVVLRSASVPPDLVTMHSTIFYEDDRSGTRTVITIVYPPEADTSKGKVSVLAPLGTALLGLSVGQSIIWSFPDGTTRTLRVVELVYQPEAAEEELCRLAREAD